MTKEEKKKLKPTSKIIVSVVRKNNKIHNKVAKQVVGVFKRKGFGMNYFNKKDN